jgi:hypothetical protein
MALHGAQVVVVGRLESARHSSANTGVMQGLHVSEELATAVFERGNEGYRVRRSGLDNVEFLLAAGPAEPLRPLGAVASGGESARVMLALKAAPALARAQDSAGNGSATAAGTSWTIGTGFTLILAAPSSRSDQPRQPFPDTNSPSQPDVGALCGQKVRRLALHL